jgi:Recombination endonuclease VII
VLSALLCHSCATIKSRNATPEHRERNRQTRRKWFSKNKGRINQLARERHARNREENNAKQRAWVAGLSPETKKAYKLKNMYGISYEQYEEMLKMQNNLCFVCGKDGTEEKPLFVDHDHATEEVRGLLCHRCNMTLGFLERNEPLLPKFSEYLRNPPHREKLTLDIAPTPFDLFITNRFTQVA